MQRFLLKSKLHRLTVTDANLDYEGSITLDPDLIDVADFVPWERVHVWDATNGQRIKTYIIEGERGSGEVCINGAAAHKVNKGDIIIVASFAVLDETEIKFHIPKIIKVDENNKPIGGAR